MGPPKKHQTIKHQEVGKRGGGGGSHRRHLPRLSNPSLPPPPPIRPSHSPVSSRTSSLGAGFLLHKRDPFLYGPPVVTFPIPPPTSPSSTTYGCIRKSESLLAAVLLSALSSPPQLVLANRRPNRPAVSKTDLREGTGHPRMAPSLP